MKRNILSHSKLLKHYGPAHYWRFKCYVELVDKRIARSDKVLDIGCGDGNLLANLRQGRKYGVDINKNYLKVAKMKNPNANFREAEAEKLPFKNETFDWVFCTEVIEHLKRPRNCLAEAKRVLRKGGGFVVSTYNHQNFFNLITTKAFSKKPRFPEIHMREYNWRSFTKLISSYFKVIERNQAGSSSLFDLFLRATKLPIGDFMIILARKS